MAKKKEAAPATLDPKIQAMVDQAKALAKDGTKLIEELTPELPWEKMANLVGSRILIMAVEKGYSELTDDVQRVTFVKEDDSAWRVTCTSTVVNSKLVKLADRLPLWVNVVKRDSRSGYEYYDLE